MNANTQEGIPFAELVKITVEELPAHQGMVCSLWSQIIYPSAASWYEGERKEWPLDYEPGFYAFKKEPALKVDLYDMLLGVVKRSGLTAEMVDEIQGIRELNAALKAFVAANVDSVAWFTADTSRVFYIPAAA